MMWRICSNSELYAWNQYGCGVISFDLSTLSTHLSGYMNVTCFWQLCPPLLWQETEREGRLLTMLEQSESILTDENNSALDFSGMSPPREEQAGSFSSSHLSISDSPIRSFVSISEIKDCLVDFKKQLSRPPKHQPNKKRPQHRGKRRRMWIFKPGTKSTCLFVGNYMMRWL